MSPDQLFQRVAEIAPSFAAVQAEHLRDNGELLNHVLMGDLLRFLGARVGQQERTPSEVVAILELLESAVGEGNADTENLIAVSFLENLEAEGFFSSLFGLLGPQLRAAHTPFVWQQPPSQNAG